MCTSSNARQSSRIRRNFPVSEWVAEIPMRTFVGVSKRNEDIWCGANVEVWLTGWKSETPREM